MSLKMTKWLTNGDLVNRRHCYQTGHIFFLCTDLNEKRPFNLIGYLDWLIVATQKMLNLFGQN